MMMTHTYLLTLKDVRELGGTYYVEIAQGYYSDFQKCWHPQSVYLEGDIWLKFFDGIGYDTIEDYDFYEFMELNQQQAKIFSDKLLDVANRLQVVKSFDELTINGLYSIKTQQPYIKINNGFRNLLASDEQSVETDRFYQENFDAIIRLLISTYQNLADWIADNGKNGISILGI